MVNGLHLYCSFSHLPIHIHTLTHQWWYHGAAMQGANLPIGGNMGLSVFLKDTLTHGDRRSRGSSCQPGD